MNNEEFMDEPKFSRLEFDYKQMLLIHLRNISRLVTNIIFPSSQEPYSPIDMTEIINNMIDERFIKAVSFFQQLLSPYFDEQYKKDMKELSEQKHNDNVNAMLLSGILIQLMDRKNLLLESEEESKL